MSLPATSRKRPPPSPAESNAEDGSSDVDRATGAAHSDGCDRRGPGPGDEDGDCDPADDKRNRMRKEIASLHQEMEITGYAKTKSGQRRRKMPRDESKRRTQKRKLLEKADAQELAVEVEDGDDPDHDGDGKNGGRAGRMKRLRGSRAAMDGDIVQNSLVFHPRLDTGGIDEGEVEDEEEDDEDGVGDEHDDDSDHERNLVDEIQAEVGDAENVSDEEVQATLGDESDAAAEEFEQQGGEFDGQKGADQEAETHAPLSTGTTRKQSRPTLKQRRRMYRLRNFQSFKMAERHGDALAAHARGQPGLAIEKLKAVAKAAPSAPQVYSSLGMVYEDMLKESRKRSRDRAENNLREEDQRQCVERERSIACQRESIDPSAPTATSTAVSVEDAVPDADLAEQLTLAKKAYGSYHIAAILCKKDFTLWVRAAESASGTADIHGEIMTFPNLSKEVCEYHRSEQRRWQSEALRDFLAADNLKPPGIDVPAKLAVAHIELGNLSEAFTILTDLKNRAGFEFRSSYKAWMLYSDLMLRLGHECIQWNRKVQTNENYMVRRWLRKFSKVFDWQERRLQALSLALEAAAGTTNTERFVAWIRKRAIEGLGGITNETEKTRNESSTRSETLLDAYQHSEHIQNSQVDTDLSTSEENRASPVLSPFATNPNTNLQLVEEKRLLVGNQSKELEAFDKTTTDMGLAPQSAPADDRQVARNSLLKAHESAVDALVTEYNQKDILSMHSEEQNEKIILLERETLPISGSIRQVCLIASELMKHLHGLELYEGARLVGESVSKYLKDRARRHESTLESKKKADEWQHRVRVSPFMLGTYDDNGGEESDSDVSPYLSDDDMLLNSSKSELFGSLRLGVLPPELRVVYGMALIGEGDRNFVALKCIEAIDLLDQESKLWLSDGERETELAADPQWFLFRRAMTEPLGRTAAYAFCADVLRKTNKEKVWALNLSPMFRRHLETMKRVGLTDELLRLREEITPNVNFRKNQLLKVILAACRFDIDTIDESAAKTHVVNGNSSNLDDATRIKIACSAITSLASVMPLVWTVEHDGGLSQICKEIVSVSARCLRWLCGSVLQQVSYSMLKSILEQATILVSFLCGDSIPFLGGASDESMKCLMSSLSFPIDASWQPNEYRTLSIRAYNLSVGCNVSLFSGWENEEFTLKLLRRRYGHRHFGVHIRERRIAGCLPSVVEEELVQQWNKLGELEPAFPVLNVAEKLSHVKQLEWYRKEIEIREESGDGVAMASFGEDDALEILLRFSALCLHQAASEKDRTISNRSCQLALSVLIPVSQFCLDETLWDSDIGEAAALLSSYDEWRLMAGSTKYEAILDVAQEKTPFRRRRVKRAERILDQKLKEWIDGSDAPHRTFIAIPTIEMTKLWKKARSTHHDVDDAEALEAKEKMQNVQKTMQDLRACFSIAAAEKACLNMSAALLAVAAIPSCYDPFSCLQQAAMFASQAAKAGSSDITFQRALPEMSICTPLEALTILGRADCLNAVYFPNEAAYLCSYVATVCRLKRKEEETNLPWNDEWKIIAINAYNVSVMIRTSVSTILDDQMKKSFLAAWTRDVVEELERGRKDGIAWKRQLTLQTTDAGKIIQACSTSDSHVAKDPMNSDAIANADTTDNDEDIDTPFSDRLDDTSGHDDVDDCDNKSAVYSPKASGNQPQNFEFEPQELTKSVACLLESPHGGGQRVVDDDDGMLVCAV